MVARSGATGIYKNTPFIKRPRKLCHQVDTKTQWSTYSERIQVRSYLDGAEHGRGNRKECTCERTQNILRSGRPSLQRK